MSEAETLKRIGLAGHRSFIARALVEEAAYWGHDVHVVSKWDLGTDDMSGMDCVYLVLGRDRPSPMEAAAELEQVRSYAENPKRATRTVYLSSRRSYVHKQKAEALINEIGGLVVRPPAVFGPGQRPDSEMLIPSLVRTAGSVQLERPHGRTEFIHVGRLAHYLAGLVDPSLYATEMGFDGGTLPGEFTLSPEHVRDLYLAFKDLGDAWDDRGVGR